MSTPDPPNPPVSPFTPRTESQKNASRINGKKSRGPVTAAGKARSSANALDHGLHARSGLLAKAILLPGESRARFDDLLAHFRIEFAPATYVEHCFVEHMVVAQWRLMRTWTLERAGICQAAGTPPPGADYATCDAAALLSNPGPLRAFNFCEMRYERQLSRSFDKFFRLRAITRAGHAAENVEAEDAQTENTRNEPESSV